MSYTLDISLALGAGKAGLTDLRAQLVNTAGADVGGAVSTGFTEIGTSVGYYLWHYAAFPDAHRGGVKFYSAAASSVILAFVAVNPEEAENTDVKSSVVDDNVWTVGTRTITGGTVSTVSDKTGYSLSAAGVQAIWDALTAALTTANSIGKRIADNLDSTVSGVPTAVWALGTRALTDKAGFSLSSAGIQAIWDALTANLVTANSIGKRLADNIDSTISGVAASAATAVWAAVSRTLTDKTGFSLSSAGVQAVWDALTVNLTTAGSVGKRIADNLDAAVSAASGASAQEVWEYATRELTAFTALASDIWTYAVRTLTEQLITQDANDAINVSSYIGVTFDALFEGLNIPATYTKIYFTVKDDTSLADSTALIQVVVTNPAAGTDGLKYLNGAAATAAQGSLTVSQGNGTVQVVVADDAMASLSPANDFDYDIKVITSGGTSQILSSGLFHVLPTPTKSVS